MPAQDNNSSQTFYPAGYNDYVIAVGATDQYDYRASFSNWGSHIDIVAPGTTIWSTNSPYSQLSYPDWWGQPFRWMDGTSQATPFVSGLASLILSKKPYLSTNQVWYIIASTADDITYYGIGWDQYTGYGRINAYNALYLTLFY